MTLIENFRANVREALAESGQSQRSLARVVGIHFVTLNRILSGDVSPSVETCENIAKAAGIRPDIVFLQPSEKNLAKQA